VGVGEPPLARVVTPRASFWADRQVLVTGHTGFKGAWLSLWLTEMGAHVHGYSLDPVDGPTVFDAGGVVDFLDSDTRADLRDQSAVRETVDAVRPEIVFHLAAQPLVSAGYQLPSETWATNVMGTVHVLEAVRHQPSVRAVVVITTDKVYADHGIGVSHLESNRLGGHDPYSSSKAAVELVAASYRQSFWAADDGCDVRLGTARAGNVIGGGDWGIDRLIPDCIRAFETGKPCVIRSPDSVRPWQHVLEPLSGYLVLAERLARDGGNEYASAWNFGPNQTSEVTVKQVAEMVALAWGGGAEVLQDPASGHIHETKTLRLNSDKAGEVLGWSPRWNLAKAVGRTVDWHLRIADGADARMLCLDHIAEYSGSC
jgi:CDP-glucose 4,6-dehydratase